jgi:transcriptional regulator with XRE-family HTH domain
MKDIRLTLGQRIRHLRKSRKWSQEDLGEKAGLHPTYIGGIERGERNVSIVNLARLSEAFQVSLAELVAVNGHVPETHQILRHMITEEVDGDEQLASAFFTTFCQSCGNLDLLRKFRTLLPRPRSGKKKIS